MTMATYERNPMRGSTLDDLDRKALSDYLERRLPRHFDQLPLEELAQRTVLMVKSGMEVVPTVAGLLLFGELPQLVRPEWGMSAVRIQGKEISDHVVARSDLEGPIPTMVEASLAFVDDYSQRIPGREGDASEEYPRTAVREAVINALVHRDWGLTGRVSLRIFDDRLEVWSPGGPPQIDQSLDEMAREGGVSLPRNPLLAGACRVLGLGEQLGRGLAVIRREVTRTAGQSVSMGSGKADVCVVFPSALQAVMAG